MLPQRSFKSVFLLLSDVAATNFVPQQLEQEVETVVQVLQPGPLGIIEHKFSAEEVREAKVTVDRAVQSWKRNAALEKSSPFMKDYIDL
ncbi:hypothetical protein ACHQM5_026494 [Ranunculus cassubicifolius]